MAISGHFQIKDEVTLDPAGPGLFRLYLQWGQYVYDDGTHQFGYRFIYRKPNGHLQGARGQARIPSLKVARDLMAEAEKLGWGAHQGD